MSLSSATRIDEAWPCCSAPPDRRRHAALLSMLGGAASEPCRERSRAHRLHQIAGETLRFQIVRARGVRAGVTSTMRARRRSRVSRADRVRRARDRPRRRPSTAPDRTARAAASSAATQDLRAPASRRCASSGASIGPGATIRIVLTGEVRCACNADASSAARQRTDVKRNVEPLPGALFQRRAAAHALDDAARDREPQAGAAELARRAAVGLLELLEDARLRVRRDADAGVAHREADFVRLGARLDR